MRRLRHFPLNPVFCALLVLPGSVWAQTATLGEIVVRAAAERDSDLAGKRLATADSAALLSDLAGVSLNTGGGLSSLPAIHGLADERVKILIDGMSLTSACANHMNPPLSYVAPANLARIDVWAGLTPVSLGGDSIAGTIAVRSAAPIFADNEGEIRQFGQLSVFARSNGNASSAALSGGLSSHNLSIGLYGNYDTAGDYKDGRGDKVTSTYYQARSYGLDVAARGDGNLWTLKLGSQTIPKQGFVNQQMDMVSNEASFANLGYAGDFAWGKLAARAYWQDTRHGMDLGDDKPALGAMMWMPMKTHGKDIGYSLKAELPLNARDTLRVGNDFHRFTLDDWWPPVDAGPWMGPNTFVSINNGRRDRFGVFAEVESTWDSHWTTLLGVRHDNVHTDTGNVDGYSPLYAADAAAFNARSHSRRDSNWDLSALARYAPDATRTFELGYARKTRSPSLYERYAWPTDWMSSGMINWFGDGNYYVGNPDLKPEVAHTLSATADWHDAGRKQWEFKATPYFTYVEDYIGVNVINSATWGSTFNQLQFANHDARLYGVDLSAKAGLWDDRQFGYGQLSGIVGYVHGEMTERDTKLYHLMPLNAKLRLDQWINAWSNRIELLLVGRKSEVDTLRNEPTTPGYVLANLGTAYQWQNVRLDFGITNLFNKYYYLPLGGVNFDKYYSTFWSGQIGPVAGQGRSYNLGVTIKF